MQRLRTGWGFQGWEQGVSSGVGGSRALSQPSQHLRWIFGSWVGTCPHLQEKPPQLRPCQVGESSVEQASLVEP